MLVILAVLMIAALLGAVGLMILMLWRDEPMLGVYGLVVGLVAAIIALPYGVLTAV